MGPRSPRDAAAADPEAVTACMEAGGSLRICRARHSISSWLAPRDQTSKRRARRPLIHEAESSDAVTQIVQAIKSHERLAAAFGRLTQSSPPIAPGKVWCPLPPWDPAFPGAFFVRRSDLPWKARPPGCGDGYEASPQDLGRSAPRFAPFLRRTVSSWRRPVLRSSRRRLLWR